MNSGGGKHQTFNENRNKQQQHGLANKIHHWFAINKSKMIPDNNVYSTSHSQKSNSSTLRVKRKFEPKKNEYYLSRCSEMGQLTSSILTSTTRTQSSNNTPREPKGNPNNKLSETLELESLSRTFQNAKSTISKPW
ncbi:hypothetical protein AABB24_009699 [Solanum stoloniferum]|uniref:Uncharacterized protein n=1 Tax=Solanum stoloniferum TaxID=62892 RepID=A0ABD2ULK5_9SOLN